MYNIVLKKAQAHHATSHEHNDHPHDVISQGEGGEGRGRREWDGLACKPRLLRSQFVGFVCHIALWPLQRCCHIFVIYYL